MSEHPLAAKMFHLGHQPGPTQVAADRYVLPEQISSVSGDRVTLKVSKDELQKTH